jgi:hypothetical protein
MTRYLRISLLPALAFLSILCTGAVAGESPVPPGSSFDIRIRTFVQNEYGGLKEVEAPVVPLEKTAITDVAARDYRYAPGGASDFVVNVRLVCLHPHLAQEAAMKNDLRYPLPANESGLPLFPSRIFVWSKQLESIPRTQCSGVLELAVGRREGTSVRTIMNRSGALACGKDTDCPFENCQSGLESMLLKALSGIFR